jgi:hypothetical protein
VKIDLNIRDNDISKCLRFAFGETVTLARKRDRPDALARIQKRARTETLAVLDGLHKQLGFIPNLFLVMAQSPNGFSGFIGLQKSLSRTLDPKLRARISLAVSEVNQGF